MKRMLVVLTVALVLLLVGCATHNQTALNKDGVSSITSDAHTGIVYPNGLLEASYHGLGASLLNQDAEGNYLIAPGPGGVLSIRGEAYIFSPKDVKIGKMTYTPEPSPGQPAIVVENLEANISEPLGKHVLALEVALPILATMTEVEALATVERWKIIGAITESVAAKLIEILVAG